jgi:pantoate--beta-alanine ligase
MVKDLNLPVAIEGIATVREADGLALSSRNRYLSHEERAIAPMLYHVLSDTAVALRGGASPHAALDEGKSRILAAGFRNVDYLELRHAESLMPLDAYQAPARLLVAAHLGSTRLIDNIEV